MGHDDHDRGQKRGCDPEQEISLLESKRLATILGGIHGELQLIRLLLTDQNRLLTEQNQHLERGFKAMTAAMTDLLAAVTEQKGWVQSLLALTTGLHDLLIDAQDDPAQIVAIANDMRSQSTAIQAALLANPLPGQPTTIPPTDPNVPPFDPNNPNAPQFNAGNPVNVSGDFRTGARGTQQFDQRNAPNDDQLAQFMSQNPKATPAQIESFRTSRTGSTQFGRDGSRNQPFDSSSPTRTPPTDAELARFKTENPNATPDQINQFRMLPR